MICAPDNPPVSRQMRRARLLAARSRPVRGINRKAILGGQWDSGSVVRAFLGEEARGVAEDRQPTARRLKTSTKETDNE